MSHNFDTYSEQILSFKLSGQLEKENFSVERDAHKTAQQHLKFAHKRKAKALIVFGAADVTLVQSIISQKPDHLKLIICDLHPEHIRELGESFFKLISTYKNTFLLTDSSIWAMLLQLTQSGLNAKNCHLLLNPALNNKSKATHQTLQKLFSGLNELQLPHKIENIKISGAAILSPTEPELKEFIESFPSWLEEIILIWDCSAEDDYPRIEHSGGVKIINKFHHLEDNFGEQRNRMLRACSGEWVIYLDADERIDKNGWNILRQLASSNECNGWYLPRLTFYPDEEHCRAGYGLWPDLQMRFFRNSEKLVFVNKIHEQLHGIIGAPGIIPTVSIKHLTHLLKSREHIESKLKSFNEATQGQFSHKLGDEFPYVETKLLNPSEKHPLMPVILPKLNLK